MVKGASCPPLLSGCQRRADSRGCGRLWVGSGSLGLFLPSGMMNPGLWAPHDWTFSHLLLPSPRVDLALSYNCPEADHVRVSLPETRSGQAGPGKKLREPEAGLPRAQLGVARASSSKVPCPVGATACDSCNAHDTPAPWTPAPPHPCNAVTKSVCAQLSDEQTEA